MTKAAIRPSLCCAAARGRPAAVLRWVVVLYILSLGAPLLQGLAAQAAVAGTVLVQLCTVGGVKQVAVDQSGQPIDHEPSDHHAAHHCVCCLSGCAKHGAATGFGQSLPFVADRVPEAPVRAASRPRSAPTVGAPLPARGPPTIS